ncbi:AMP-binding protein [Dokdonella sp.]|uniref:AMP-binding protein n=1 Tax=Dokdonella sp. TaxID=2291710 RepID=UPI003C33C0BB
MTALVNAELEAAAGKQPLLANAADNRIVAWRDRRAVRATEFLADISKVAALLPDSGCAINLCENRYAFLVSFCAAASRGQATLLPASRAPQAIADVRSSRLDSYLLGDAMSCLQDIDMIRLPELDGTNIESAAGIPMLDPRQVVAIGFTSGSTSQPKPNTKTWDNFRIGSAQNIGVLESAIGLAVGQTAHVLATVPAQHMYGMELSVLLPLFGRFAVHSGKTFFPADVARSLGQIPEPRLLVTTPVHLRALLRADIELPTIAALVSATAPLPAELAREAEQRFSAPVVEMFGSTETCVIAHRRTAIQSDWNLYDDVDLKPQPDGTLVEARHLSQPTNLQDIVEVLPGRKFRLHGRNADMLEIAGKRASLADLTRRLHALEGVLDAVVFQVEAGAGAPVRRIAALAVAPGRSEKELLAELRTQMDPVFLPRPLRVVKALPRNETGKLPLQALVLALAEQAAP